MEEIIHLEKAKENKKAHIPSTIQADTLFTFCDKLEYLKSPIKSKMISARYCAEDIKYLHISKLKKIAFPMKCFCDINMHKLDEHLSWYGYYGIGLTKEWGMKNGIQPVQYINPESQLIKDFSKVFSKSLETKNEQTKNEILLKNYILHQLLYFKPYSGNMKNRITKKIKPKCFTDECEWRYIPNVSSLGYKQIYYNENILNLGILNEFSKSMAENPEISLKFNYEDLKYIIVKSKEDFDQILSVIDEMKIEKKEKSLLISKIIIWELSGGDF